MTCLCIIKKSHGYLFSLIIAGQKFGGCGDGIGCSDKKAPKCDQNDKDWESDTTGLIGTCIPKSGDFSSVTFGSGKSRTGTIHDDATCDTFYTSNSN